MISERMPMIPREQMTDTQRAAAEALIAGPRKAVIGPFIPLLRSPGLLATMQRVGEYLRFHSPLSRRAAEFATLVVARQWTQHFEWHVHVPLAHKAGTADETIDDLRVGRRPRGMSDEEGLVYDFLTELTTNKGVSDATYAAAVERFGEAGVVDLVGVIGYFTAISMVLNMAGTPANPAEGAKHLPGLP